MYDLLAAASVGEEACLSDGIWDTANRVIERHVLRHVHAAGMQPDDLDLHISESEHPEQAGRPALRISMGQGDTYRLAYVDWHGKLAWRRTHAWLDHHVRRQIARRRWILAMVEKDIDPSTAPFAQRTIHPLLRPFVRSGLLSIDMLPRPAETISSARYVISGDNGHQRRTHHWHDRIEVEIDGLPAMDIHVDYDRVMLHRMALSKDVCLYDSPEGPSIVRLGRHRLPHTVLFALTYRPLSDLIDSPLLRSDAMPIIDRLRLRRNGSPEVILRRSANLEMLLVEPRHA